METSCVSVEIYFHLLGDNIYILWKHCIRKHYRNTTKKQFVVPIRLLSYLFRGNNFAPIIILREKINRFVVASLHTRTRCALIIGSMLAVHMEIPQRGPRIFIATAHERSSVAPLTYCMYVYVCIYVCMYVLCMYAHITCSFYAVDRP